MAEKNPLASLDITNIRIAPEHGISVVERPLHRHAKAGNLSALLRLLEEGADINETDEHGDTALIMAAQFGHCKIMIPLIDNGADVSHTNNHEEDVFQIAVIMSDQIAVLETLLSAAPHDSAKGEFKPVIQSIASALAKAASLGSVDKIEVFLKSNPGLNICDNDGNTIFHYAAKADREEVIVRFSQHFDINVQNKKDGDTPLHVACKQGHNASITTLLKERADPCLQNREEDTVLHCFVRATAENQGQADRHGEVFDMLVDRWTRWSMMKNLDENKREAVNRLIREEKNGKQESIMSLAFEVGAIGVISKLLVLQEITFTKNSSFSIQQYDITNVTPITKGSDTSGRSCLELLLDHNSNETIAHVLDLEPLKKIEKMYSSTTTFIYLIVIFLHALYMSLFSYSSTVLMDKLRTSPSDHSFDTATLIFYSVAPLEPICFLLALVHRFHCSRQPWTRSGFQALGTFMLQCFSIIHHVIYSLLVAALLYQFHALELYSMHNTLSITLLIGWLTTLSFTQGLKPIRFFWRMILQMIMIDVYKILFVYAFVLLSFSFALHVLFQISAPIIETYPTPFHTMFLVFRLMFGMSELFDDNFENNMKKAGGSLALPIIIFTVYIVLATLILLNILIAMMNTSYSHILTNLKLSRRIETFQRSIQLERTVPFLTKLFNKALIRCGKFDNQKKQFVEEKGGRLWYLQFPRRLEKETRFTQKAHMTLEQMLTQRIDALDDDFKGHLQLIQKTLENIQKELVSRRMSV
ncbi:transient receptor potential cation channel subfamily V member 3-like [Haliotis rufescens]|uniref:transient receptor potential cation channel subfamily V member 3-like n=1 Tax=Haliotis rufescens TaxID=6454 RepID=UPI00201E7E71|nr:transient receptor potential cation channel subfamily V member 3-like [Haliotis rufescens]